MEEMKSVQYHILDAIYYQRTEPCKENIFKYTKTLYDNITLEYVERCLKNLVVEGKLVLAERDKDSCYVVENSGSGDVSVNQSNNNNSKNRGDQSLNNSNSMMDSTSKETPNSRKKFKTTREINNYITKTIHEGVGPFVKKIETMLEDFTKLTKEKNCLHEENAGLVNETITLKRDLSNLKMQTEYQAKLIENYQKEVDFLKGELLNRNEIISIMFQENRNKEPTKENIDNKLTSYKNINGSTKKSLSKHVANGERSSSVDIGSLRKPDGNKPKTPQSNNKHQNDIPKIEVIGDSLLNGIDESRLSSKGNVKVRNYPGATTEDLKDHANPTIRKNVDLIIIHAGTNDITRKSDTIPNLQAIVNRIKKKSSNTKIAISSLITRKDRRNIENEVVKLNNELKAFCDENLLDYIDNENIDESCLGIKKLHLNRKGNAYLAKNIINYTKSVY